VIDSASSNKPTFRIALEIEYDGSHFAGWQKQADPELPTVQQRMESALSKIADAPVSLICAGRTDRGVHATGQVVHFDCELDRGNKAWVIGANSLLPSSIRIKWAQLVANDFHARFSATARRYLYLLYDTKIAPALLVNQLTHVAQQLDIKAMDKAADYLLGENDFSSFQASGCQSKSSCRCIHWLKVARKNSYIIIDIQANAFLQHMVRNIVGMLLEVGRGDRNPSWAKELLQKQDRTAGGVTAPANGLYLIKVTYPEDFNLPGTDLGPSFLHPYS